MAATKGATVVRIVAGLILIAWPIDGRGQPRQDTVHSESVSPAPASASGGATPAAQRHAGSAAPTPQGLPLTTLSTERPSSATKNGDGAVAGDAKKAQPSSNTPPSGSITTRSTPTPVVSSRKSSAATSAAASKQTPRRARDAGPQPRREFDATLETILHSPERRLAIIDGRIVQIGDEIRGSRIVDITPRAVFLRDAAGVTRTLSLGHDASPAAGRNSGGTGVACLTYPCFVHAYGTD
jgi:hypothetical protein